VAIFVGQTMLFFRE